MLFPVQKNRSSNFWMDMHILDDTADCAASRTWDFRASHVCYLCWPTGKERSGRLANVVKQPRAEACYGNFCSPARRPTRTSTIDKGGLPQPSAIHFCSPHLSPHSFLIYCLLKHAPAMKCKNRCLLCLHIIFMVCSSFTLPIHTLLAPSYAPSPNNRRRMMFLHTEVSMI